MYHLCLERNANLVTYWKLAIRWYLLIVATYISPYQGGKRESFPNDSDSMHMCAFLKRTEWGTDECPYLSLQNARIPTKVENSLTKKMRRRLSYYSMQGTLLGTR